MEAVGHGQMFWSHIREVIFTRVTYKLRWLHGDEDACARPCHVPVTGTLPVHVLASEGDQVSGLSGCRVTTRAWFIKFEQIC